MYIWNENVYTWLKLYVVVWELKTRHEGISMD